MAKAQFSGSCYTLQTPNIWPAMSARCWDWTGTLRLPSALRASRYRRWAPNFSWV